MMVGKVKPRTQSDQRRFDALKDMGCICCIKMGLGKTPCEIHHITDSGRRMGHEYTLPLCTYHHRGVYCSGMKQEALAAGPPLTYKRAFVEVFGTELELLEEVNGRLNAATCS